MKEHSAGAIITRDNKFLLLKYKYKTVYWDFPRGNVENRETEEEAARREIKEETGITSIEFLPSFKEEVKWTYHRDGNLVKKSVTFFLARTTQSKIQLSSEHLDFEWLSYEDAMKKLTYDTAKTVLKKASMLLQKTMFL
ncbi:MAG TPA: NUDIX domain-containing protein [Candidatus Nanoarchaeia archaeon]|nr:NUDIX domain-containing protein [Candidatus Nanoarchaeia archaeon]